MNKKMRELLTKIEEKRTQAKAFMDGENKDIEKATSLLDEADALQKEYEVEKRLYEAEKESNTPTDNQIAEKEKENKEKDSVKEFADSARNGFKNKKMNEGTQADGGYTVPEDITTLIHEWRDLEESLLSEVAYEKVTTNKGARTYKKRAQQTGFTKVGEGAKIGASTTPQFERVTYEIEKYAGYFPVTNELLADSDQNIVDTLVKWIGGESRATANKLILEQIATVDQTDLKDLDGVQKALIVTLGQRFIATSKIHTNDDGLLYLNTLKDANGRPLLNPDPTAPKVLRLSVGAITVPVKVWSNDLLKTSENKIPMIVGDLKEAIKYWDRASVSIKTSDVATIGSLNAYEEDLTLWRAIEREDVTTLDKTAIVNGYITVAEILNLKAKK